MGLFRRALERFGRLALTVSSWRAGRPWGDVDFSYAKAYEQNALVYAAVQFVATALAEAPLRVYHEDMRPYENHPLEGVLRRPFPGLSQGEWLAQVVISKKVWGDSFINIVQGESTVLEDGPIQGFQLLPTQNTRLIVDTKGITQAYEVKVPGSDPMILKPQDVIHLRNGVNILNPSKGMSDIQPILSYVDLDNASFNWVRSFYLNEATPAGILKVKGRTNATERNRIKEMWKENFAGLAVIDAQADYQKIGAGLNEINVDIFDHTESRIAMALGVPAILISALSGLKYATYSNYEQAIIAFYEKTLKPEWKLISEKLTDGLRRATQRDDFVVAFDLAVVEALNESEAARRTFLISALGADMIDREEARALSGLPLLSVKKGKDTGKSAKQEQGDTQQNDKESAA